MLSVGTRAVVEDRGPEARKLCIAMTVLPIAFLIIRIWSRIVSHKGRFSLDDYFAGLALVRRNPIRCPIE